MNGRAADGAAGVAASLDAADALSALSALGTGIVIVDASWRIVFVNQAWTSMLGVRASDYVGRGVRDAFPAIPGRREGKIVRATMADGVSRSFRVEYRDARLDGVYDIRVARGARGTLVFEVADVSAIERQALDLAARSEENESLRKLARALSAVTDSDALLRILCHAALDQCRAAGVLVGQPRGTEWEVVAGCGCVEGLHGIRVPGEHLALIEHVVRTREAIAIAQYSNASPALQEIVERLDIGPALIVPLVAHDEVLGILAVVGSACHAPFSAADEARLRVIADHASLTLYKAHLLEEAQAANEAKSTFLATMSHELRTPLAALTGYGELLADEIIGRLSEPQHEVVERMRGVTHHLTAMIDEILTFASLEAGREIVRPTPVRAHELVRAAVAVIEPLARQKGIPIEVLGDEPARPLVTDADKVRQILVNLTGNAVKFTERGHIQLGVESDNGLVRFTVHDTGIGISPADQTRLFQPFTQLDAGLTRRHGGTGLGLYISRRLAAILGGDIAVESEIGRGATFTLTLPVERERHPA